MRWLWIAALIWLVGCGPSPEEQELQVLLAERRQRIEVLKDRLAHLPETKQRIAAIESEMKELAKTRPFRMTFEDPDRMVENFRSELGPGLTLVKTSELQPGTADFQFRRAELRLSGKPAQLKKSLEELASTPARPTRLVQVELVPKNGLLEGTATVDFYLRAWP